MSFLKKRNYKNVTLKIGFHQKDFVQLISFLNTHCLYSDKQTNHNDNILNLSSLRSFVGGASNDEIDRDMMYARQPYNGANTPNLVYSDYESRSTTTDTAEEEVDEHEEGARRGEEQEEQYERQVVSPSAVTNTTTAMMSERRTFGDNNNIIHRNDISQQQVHHPIRNILPPPTPSASSSAFHNSMYPQPPHPPPYGFEEISAERWWPFRSTTTA